MGNWSRLRPPQFGALIFLLLGLAADASGSQGDPAPGTMRLLTLGPTGLPAVRGAAAFSPSISADGRFVAFVSDATDYVPVAHGSNHVFVKDRVTGGVELVSQSSTGVVGAGRSDQPVISADGRYVAFISQAGNLVDQVVNSGREGYVRDRLAGTTERVTTPADGSNTLVGCSSLTMSADGRYVVFITDSGSVLPGEPEPRPRVVLRDRLLQRNENVAIEPDGAPTEASFWDTACSADARFIAYSVNRGSNSDDPWEVWLRDRQSQTTTQVNRTGEPAYQPSISADGRFVFCLRYGSAGGLVWNRLTDERVEYPGLVSPIELSGDGSTLLAGYWKDPQGALIAGPWHVDRATGVRTRIPQRPDGGLPHHGPYIQGSGGIGFSITPDARTVVYASAAYDLVAGDTNGRSDVFAWTLETGLNTRVSVRANGTEAALPSSSEAPAQTPDGRYVVFISNARDLVADDVGGLDDVFVLDRSTGLMDCASRSSAGEPANQHTFRIYGAPAITPNGRHVVFISHASNLVPGDTNNRPDIFLRDRATGLTERVSVDTAGRQAPLGAFSSPAVSADGRCVAFGAWNALDGRRDAGKGLFIRDRLLARTERVSVETGGRWLRGDTGSPAISADGQFVYFMHSRWGEPRLLLRDRRLRRTTRVLVQPNQSWTVGSSADSRYAILENGQGWRGPRQDPRASGVVVFDRARNKSTRVGLQDDGREFPRGAERGAISPDGRWAVFAVEVVPDSARQVDLNLPPPPPGPTPYAIYLRDLDQGRTHLVSRATDGSTSALSWPVQVPASVSAFGRCVVFPSTQTQLLPGMTIEGQHLYALDRS